MNRGLFKPTVMFFGLTNSPATFQTMMDDVKRVSAGEFEGRLVPMLEIRGRSVSDPTVENTHLGTAARLDAFSGREAKQGRIEKRKRGRRAEEETRPREKREKNGGKDYCPFQLYSTSLCTYLATVLLVVFREYGGEAIETSPRERESVLYVKSGWRLSHAVD